MITAFVVLFGGIAAMFSSTDWSLD